MQRTRKRWSLPALLLTLAMLAAACGSDDDSSTGTDDTTGGSTTDSSVEEGEAAPMTGGTISNGIIEPTFIDSYNVQDSEGFVAARLIFDGLTDLNEGLEAVPAVASEWTTEDNITWEFTLRDDVTFHNGDPVTAQSFVDAFNRVANPNNVSDVAYYGSVITGIQGWAEVEAGEATEVTGAVAVDDTHLTITLTGPYPLLPKAMAHPVFSPVDLAAVEAGGDSYGDAPVGNGPYMMNGPWEHDVQISVVRYDGYYGDPGLADQIDFKIYDSIETMYLEAQAGSVDIAEVPPENIATAETDFPGRFVQLASGSYNYLGLPIDQAPYDNPDIRKALAMAIDRDTIAEQIFSGGRAPADRFVPPLAPGAGEACGNLTYDPDAAKAMFDAAGGIPGGKVTIYFNSGGGHEQWVQAVANGWQQTFGIESEFVAQEFAPYLDQLQAGDVDGPFRLGWQWDLPSAENFLSPLFLTGATDNHSHYGNPDFDAAIEAFKLAPSEEEGYPSLATAQDIVCEDMPVIPMFFGNEQRVYTEAVDNVQLSVFGYVVLEDVEAVGQ
ncbi:MAG: ABC transporter substrate-binding protein [Acidimicrobiales bacterium]